MADGFNKQYSHSPEAMFGGGNFADSGAPGSVSYVKDGPGASLGSAVVSSPYESVQVQEGRPTADVDSTDTNSGSGRMTEDVAHSDQTLDPGRGHAWVPRGPATFSEPRQ